ncbi:MAG: glycosyltransferase family 9 protein, partial [Chthoniobacterales bacterium]
FGSFQQVVSYLFDPDGIFEANLRRAGVRQLVVGSPRISGPEHAARQLARPLEQLALYLENPAPSILPNENHKTINGLIGLHPGSGSEKKNWPLDRFVRLAASLLEETRNLRLLFVGGEADAERMAHLSRSLPNERVERAENLALPELARRLQGCAVFVGHDSGVSHLAAAVGVPCLLLFGPTDPAVWAPANRDVRVLRAADRTMAGIELSDVISALRELTS